MDQASLSPKDREAAFRLFILLGGLFIAALVSCNLIFRKFFSWELFDGFSFEQSVGILPYPITFLITDLISEIYGAKRANQVVFAGLFASLFVLLIIYLGNAAPATSWSPVTDDQYSHVFGQTAMAVGASMTAYLIAQFIDIRVFHFWKRLTKGKMLWVRNNFSTLTSQFIDTFTVILLLCLGGEIEWALFWTLVFNGFLFKALVALFDTPLFYLTSWAVRKRFKLEVGQEISLF
ncbi:queuosine precursor transporter [Sanyastnella coralliicola]|uniref:queuosine precursor transporter n=1 Tax=Sanyastnella coralliicola TaxID=3069118 RepID=UPI0027B9CD96|nr:queuosine precursor transporter [Longitalea sp. SCSIO 12813]